MNLRLDAHFPVARCEYRHERRRYLGGDADLAAYERDTDRQCWVTTLYVDGQVRGIWQWEITRQALGLLEEGKANAERRLAIELTMLDEIRTAIEDYYRRPGNEVGGPLHLVLDDHNIDNSSIDFCFEAAAARGDEAGMALAHAIRRLPLDKRREIFGLTAEDDETP